jgi:hypothetical protein
MLSADDHPGVFTFMVGMIVLVMAGVGLSLVIDRRLSFSSGKLRTQREINLDAAELESLAATRDERSRLLESRTAKPQNSSESAAEILGRTETMRQRQAILEDARKQLHQAIAGIEDDFSRFRAEYRRSTWTGAQGEKLGNLALANGREYRDATITRVTDVGLEIRHSDGIARIQAPDLDPKIQDRFQWNDEERRKILKQESEHLEGIAAGPVEEVPAITAGIAVPPVSQSRRPLANKAPDSNELATLRRLVIGWKSKVAKLRLERSVALSNSGYGSQTSVPGSLETWGAKAARLGNELARASSELAVAKSNLAAVAPADPLLRPEEPDR